MSTLVFGGIVAIIVGAIGTMIKKIYRDRVTYLEDYNSFLSELIEEISFLRSPMNEFIDRVIESKHSSFRKTLVSYRDSLSNCKDFEIESNLKSEDKKIIQNCLQSIGRNDASTEILNIKNNKILGEKLLNIAEHELKSRGELLSKLMILLGIALMILLV